MKQILFILSLALLILSGCGLKDISTISILALDVDYLNHTNGTLSYNGTFLTPETNRALGTGLINIEGVGIEETNNTVVTIYAGSGYILNISNPDNPILTKIEWLKQNVTDPYTTTNLRTFFGIGLNGTPKAFPDEITARNRRDYIQVGASTHIDGLTITSTTLAPLTAYDNLGKIHDIGQAIKGVNLEGNVYCGYNSTSMKLCKSEGTTYGDDKNYNEDKVSTSINYQPEFNPVPYFFFAYRDGVGGQIVGVKTEVDSIYFDGYGNGTLQNLSEGFWVTHRLYTSVNTGSTTLVYGQEQHKGKIEALHQLSLEHFEKLDGTNELLLRGFITIKQGVTSLDNKDAIFTPADKFGQMPTNRASNGFSLGNPSIKDYEFTSQGIGAGRYYVAGYYEAPTTDANLDQVTTSITYGDANALESAHGFIVTGGEGVVDTGQVGIRANCTTFTDLGVLTISNSEIITNDITTTSLNQYLEVANKCEGIMLLELYVVSGTPTTYSLNFNYGFTKYEDFGNRDFMVVGFEVVGLAGATDTGFDIALKKHSSSGWTYAPTGFIAGNDDIVRMTTDLGTYRNLINNKYFSYKRLGMNSPILGSESEGVIVEIITTANNAVQYMDLHLGVEY